MTDDLRADAERNRITFDRMEELYKECWLEGELRLEMGADVYNAQRHETIRQLERWGTIRFLRLDDNHPDEMLCDRIFVLTEQGEYDLQWSVSRWEADMPLGLAAGDVPDLVPVWMVSAAEDILRVAQFETEQPHRQTIPARYSAQLHATIRSRRQSFMPLPPVVLRVKRELLSFGKSEVSGPFAGTPG